jgi:hypothetical protein
MQPIKLFKIFLSLFRWNALAYQILIFSKNQGVTVVVKVDMVYENLKDLKLEVPIDDTTFTLRDAITIRVQWRRTSIDVDPSVEASALTTLSQPNTDPSSIFPDTRLSASLIREQSCPSPI